MKNLLSKIDHVLCGYLGLDKNELTPHSIQRQGNQLMVLNTESFKRHLQTTPISEIALQTINKVNKEKLGRAAGKAIATNLIVSFEEIMINRDLTHER